MNQILFTGDEIAREPVKKQKKVLPIKSITIFYAICVIILGGCIIGGSIYAKNRINETIEASIQPEITIERDEENNTIKIGVTHIRGISTLSYKWNDGGEQIIDAQNKTEVSTIVDLIGGENKLKIVVTEENGSTKTIEKVFVAGNLPELTLEAVANGVKITATSEEIIDYIQYKWDDEDIQKIEVGKTEYEGIINAPQGEHLLTIEVVDINKLKAKKEQKVIGDTEPTLNVTQQIVDGKSVFSIDVQDDEAITKLEYVHNGGEQQTIELNAQTYHYDIVMIEGETNTLIVRATNKNGLAKTRKVKFDNF